MGEDVSAEAATSPQGAARSTVFLSPANGHQDAFDRDDFDAVAYINEMFPTGAPRVSPNLQMRCLHGLTVSHARSQHYV